MYWEMTNYLKASWYVFAVRILTTWGLILFSQNQLLKFPTYFIIKFKGTTQTTVQVIEHVRSKRKFALSIVTILFFLLLLKRMNVAKIKTDPKQRS
jgi:hypothetical protein